MLNPTKVRMPLRFYSFVNGKFIVFCPNVKLYLILHKETAREIKLVGSNIEFFISETTIKSYKLELYTEKKKPIKSYIETEENILEVEV